MREIRDQDRGITPNTVGEDSTSAKNATQYNYTETKICLTLNDNNQTSVISNRVDN